MPSEEHRRVARPLVGILGGMGPAATVDFYDKLIKATPATTDQEHLRVVIWSDPTVPDRTAALIEGGPDPSPAIEYGARQLAAAGADVIAVACNTAHAFLSGLGERVQVPIVHMIEETVRQILNTHPLIKHVGVLATTGTVTAGLYQAELARAELHALVPSESGQRDIMRAIGLVKAGTDLPRARDLLARAAASLVDRGAGALVAGCTEIPLILGPGDAPVPIIDPAVAVAEAVVARVWTAAPVASAAEGHVPRLPR
jgi:aspartate racemase